MNNNNNLEIFVRHAVLLLVLLLLGLTSGCEDAPVGSEEIERLAIVRQVASVGDNDYVLRRSAEVGCSLFRLDRADSSESLAYSFPTDAAAFSADRQIVYYCDGQAMAAYNIASGTSQRLCELDSGFLYLDAVTANNLLFTDETRAKRCMALDTGKLTSPLHFSNGSTPVLWSDDERDAVLFWDDTASAICLYRITDDTAEILMQRERDVSRVMVTACLFQDALYYAESDGALQVMRDGAAQAVEATGHLKVVAILPTADSLLIAADWSTTKMKLYRLSDDGLDELAIWDARYSLNGSCRLFLSANSVYCILTTESELHRFPLS